MKKLLYKLLILQFPLIIFGIISLPAFKTLYQSGELMKVESVIKKNPRLYGPAYIQTDQEYKFKMLDHIPHAGVLVVGGSRCMQFRKEMFKGSFYNAGGLTLNFKDLNFTTQKIIRLKPKVIILACEQYFFNENFYLFNQISDYSASENINILNVVYHLDEDWFKGKISPFMPIPDSMIGINSIVKKNGFRRDGSRNYNEIPETYRPSAELFKDINRRIRNKNYRYEKVDAISGEALAELKKFLNACRDNHIQVIAYLPPWPSATIEALKADGSYNPYFSQLPESLKDVFNEYPSHQFYDFTYPVSLGATDEEFFDGHHASEKTYARMLKSIYEHDGLLKKYIDSDYTERVIQSPQRFGLI
jgi:hypothetical protein